VKQKHTQLSKERSDVNGIASKILSYLDCLREKQPRLIFVLVGTSNAGVTNTATIIQQRQPLNFQTEKIETMEISSYHHRRNSSISTIGSMHSIGGSMHSAVDIVDAAFFPDDLSFEEMNVTAHSQRSSWGAEMAILAATSPQIKALNLPKTPTFPKQLFPEHHRSNSNDAASFASSACSSSSTSTHESKKTGTIPPLLVSVGSGEESPTTPSFIWQDSMQIYVDGTQDLVDAFQNHNLNTSRGSSSSHHITQKNKSEDKENLHLNLLPAKTMNGRKKVTVSHRASSNRQTSLTHQQQRLPPKGSSYQIRRSSLHRRGSFDALPSPAEIGGTPKVGRVSFPFFPSDIDKAEERRLQRSGYRHTQRTQPKSMSLTIGFR
jgi:hypothetical protein